MTRDMVGYGGQWPDMRWPNGARLAVSVAVNFEEGAEAKQGKPRLLNIGYHLRIAGRPARRDPRINASRSTPNTLPQPGGTVRAMAGMAHTFAYQASSLGCPGRHGSLA